MTTIIDGKKIAKEILLEIQKEISALPFQPVFCDVLVGNDPVSLQYVNMKAQKAESIGIKFHRAEFKDTITTEELITEIKKIGEIPNICGIIIQIPLPNNFDKKVILDSVDPKLDIDCLSTVANRNFYENKSNLYPPTALACLKILDSIKLNLNDKKIVILGQGDLVGKPVAHLLQSKNLNVETINSETKEKEELIKDADVIISGIGNGKYLTGTMIKKDVVIIDAGTSESNGAIVGDVDLESVEGIAGFVSPVPGGVGPVTVAMLLNNVLSVAKNKII